MSLPATQAQKEYLRKWRAAHPEKVAAYSKTEKAKAARRAYREANRERIAEERKEYDRVRYAARREEVLRHQRSPEGREIRRAWERANREHQNQKSVEWRARNIEKARGIVRKWQRVHAKEYYSVWNANNRPKLREYARRVREKNPVKYRLYGHNRRACLHAAPGHASEVQILARVEYYGHQCAYCGGPFEALDHVIPLSKGGSNWPANIRPACTPCNSRKSNLPLAEFLRRRRVVQQAA